MSTKPTRTKEVIAHIDGGSRGNPGPAAYGIVIEQADGTRVASLSKYLGHTTNNVAEYEGLLAALNYALAHNHLRLKVISDSELLTRQINGQYKVRNPNLKILHERARALIAQLDAFQIEHVRREHNREADRLANQAMDAAKGKKLPQAHSAGQHRGQSKTELTSATHSKPSRATATYRQGVLELRDSLPIAEGENVNLEVRRKE
ncbi:MAG: ribonuclease HI family protein [Acidobacteriota bacterium]